jgi:hypothetical protein
MQLWGSIDIGSGGARAGTVASATNGGSADDETTLTEVPKQQQLFY